MKTSIRLNLLSLSVCLGVVDAVVQLEFARQAGSLAELAGRDSASASLVKSDFLWVVNATVGTPGQQVSLLISPSVADTWVPDATSSYCDESYYSNLYDDDEEEDNPTYCRWGSCKLTPFATTFAAFVLLVLTCSSQHLSIIDILGSQPEIPILQLRFSRWHLLNRGKWHRYSKSRWC